MGTPGANEGVFVTDFGLAKALSGQAIAGVSRQLTRTGETLGTPAYMSPEQARGEIGELTAASDVWALGCLLHELLVGCPPFDGTTPAEIVGNILTGRRTGGLRTAAGVPGRVRRVVDACLAPAVARRPPDAAALRDDLRRVAAGTAGRYGRSTGRRAFAAGAAALAVGAVAIAVVWSRSDAAGRHREDTPPAPTGPSPATVLARARALRATDAAGAARILRDLCRRAPTYYPAQIERGVLAWAAGDLAAARAAWRAVPPSAPEHALAQLYLGIERFFGTEGGNWREHLEPVAAGTGWASRIARGAIAGLDKRWDAARAALGDDRHWIACALRGWVERRDPAGDDRQALGDYDAALAQGIPFPFLFGDRAELLFDLSEYEKALASAERALERQPTATRWLYERGRARGALGDAAGGLADLAEVCRRTPRYAGAWHERGRLLQRTGDLRGALRALSQAVQLDPERAYAWTTRANLYLVLHEYAAARADATRALAIDPGDSAAWHDRAIANRALGDLNAALADYDGALTADPDNVDARINRATILDELGRQFEALAEYDRVLAAEPEHAVALNNRGYLRRQLGDLDGALADLTNAVAVDPDYAPAYLNLGSVHWDRHEWAPAAARWEEFCRRQPDAPEAPGLAEWIARARANAKAEADPFGH